MIAEKEALLACDHHCIISYRASFSDAQHLYLLMELALGGELFSLLDDQGRLDETQCCFYSSSLVLALDHLHLKGELITVTSPSHDRHIAVT